MRPTQFGARGGDWWTPITLFNALHAELDFTVDGAADPDSALLDRWWGPDGEVEDALLHDWGGERPFVNPPFKLARKFVAKAAECQADEATLLVPASIETKWWDQHVLQSAAWVRLIAGRVAFDKPGVVAESASQAIAVPMAIVHYDRYQSRPLEVTWAWTWEGQPRGNLTWRFGPPMIMRVCEE